VIRHAETDAELERCVEIFNAVHPDDGLALQDLKESKGSCLLHPGGGYAYVGGSSIRRWQYTMVRVHPEARRQGIATALLAAAAEVARKDGKNGGLVGRVVDPADDGSRAWAAACGFRETRQDVELLRSLRQGDGEVAEGIVEMRAEHLRGAYAVDVECVPDVPATVPMAAEPFERWHELIAAHAVTFVALDDGRVVGYATLEHLHGMPQRLEHGLTAVLRSHRGRGIATKLKQAQIAWAAANGYAQLITATDTLNLPMRRVNVKLGYMERLGAIVVEREL
jgi:GNAT superfamily N-acetyltransferase